MPPAAAPFQQGLAAGRAAAGGLAFVVALFAWAGGLHPATAAHAQIGTPVADVELATLEGGKARLLEGAAVNVLVFFRPDQERSLKTLKDIAACRRALAGSPVRWIAIVSGAAPKGVVTGAVAETRLAMPILVDEADALYGSFGVALHPVIVIVGADRRLAAFEPFRAINYCAVVTARIRHLLHEISDEEMQRVLAPPRAVEGGDAQIAGRNLRLAAVLFEAKSYDKALESVRRSLEKNPRLAPAHVLAGRILAAQGNCAEAVRAFDKALDIDPGSATAKEGAGRCKPAR